MDNNNVAFRSSEIIAILKNQKRMFRELGPARFNVGDKVWVQEEFSAYWGPACFGATRIIKGIVPQSNGSLEKLSDSNPLNVHYCDLEGNVDTPLPHLRECPPNEMLRCLSRLTLVITNVKQEQYRDITEQDAVLEGFSDGPIGDPISETQIGNGYSVSSPGGFATAKGHFMADWENSKQIDEWDYNPTLAAYTFTVHHCNIDHMGA